MLKNKDNSIWEVKIMRCLMKRALGPSDALFFELRADYKTLFFYGWFMSMLTKTTTIL